MPETDYKYDRCVRNERKLEILEQSFHQCFNDVGDRLLKIEIKQDRILNNDLKHTPNYKEVFNKRNPRDLALWLSPTIIVGILSNLDKITEFIEWVKMFLGG